MRDDWTVMEPLAESAPAAPPPGVQALQTQLVRVGLALLGQRALVWAATAVAAGLWAYAIAHPEPWRLAAAAGYSVCVLGPVYWRDLKLGGRV
jgi:hypothetical protein